MKDLRITDLQLYFRNNGKTSDVAYSKNARIDKESNQFFYRKLSDIVSAKKKTGSENVVIDEIFIPQEMWDEGIWEKYILIKGNALFVPDGSMDTEGAEIEIVIQIGQNPAPFSGKYIEHIPAQNVMKVSNLTVSILCNSILFKEYE